MREEEVVPPGGGAMYYVYTLYGFSALAIFNSVLSTLDFFIERMPNNDPNFVVSFSVTIFQIITLIFIMVYGHKVSYFCMNHGACLVQIPLTLGLPILTQTLAEERMRFIAFNVLLMAIGGVNAFQQASLYSQGGSYPSGAIIGGVSFGMGLAGVVMNFGRIFIIWIGQKSQQNDEQSRYLNALAFYLFQTVFQIAALAMLCVERRNPLALHVNERIRKQNAQQPSVSFFPKLK